MCEGDLKDKEQSKRFWDRQRILFTEKLSRINGVGVILDKVIKTKVVEVIKKRDKIIAI